MTSEELQEWRERSEMLRTLGIKTGGELGSTILITAGQLYGLALRVEDAEARNARRYP